jgi:DNA-binding transcriptional LysR family regulator
VLSSKKIDASQEGYVELRHLRYFVAVADELSFTRASRALHVAQSAVSAQVHDLEDQIGVSLFDRNSRRVRLTPAGKAFQESALHILQAADDAMRQARRIGQASYGALAIGFSGAQSHEWMPQILRRFRQAYPAVEVTLLEMVPAGQIEALLARKLDIGFIGAVEDKPPPGLRVECIAEERPLLGVPSDHPLACRAAVKLSELRDEGFVLTSRQNSPSFRAWLTRFFQAGGFVPRIVQEVDRARTGVQYVAAGFGLSIFPEHISRLPAPGVIFLPLLGTRMKIRYGLAWRRAQADEVVERFVAYAKEQFAQARE